MKELAESFYKWSVTVFGKRHPERDAKKLMEEAKEVLADPNDLEEWVDCQLCIFNAIGSMDISYDKFMLAVRIKMNTCMKSEWIEQPNGTFKRVK